MCLVIGLKLVKTLFAVFGIFGASRNCLAQGKGGRTETSRTKRFGGDGVSPHLGTQANVYHTGVNLALGIFGVGGQRWRHTSFPTTHANNQNNTT